MSSIRIIAIAAAVISLALPAALRAEDLARPTALPDAEAYLLAIIPDLQATLARAEQIGGLFSPAPIPAGTLNAAVGGALGDPALANLAKGPLMVVVGPGVPTPSVAILLPGTDLQRYIDMAAQKGFLMGKAVGGLGEVVAQDARRPGPGRAHRGRLPGHAGDGGRHRHPPAHRAQPPGQGLCRLHHRHGANGGHEHPPAARAAAGGRKDPGARGRRAARGAGRGRGLAGRHQPRRAHGGDRPAHRFAVPGSALAKALVAPAPGPNRAASRFSAAPGTVMLALLTGKLNQAALNDYGISLAEALLARPEAKDLIPADLVATFKDLLGGTGTGELAMRMRSGEKVPWQLEFAGGIADAAKTARLYDAIYGLFTGAGPVAKFYQGIGMTMVVTRNVRTTGGLPVWLQGWKIDEAKLPPGQSAMSRLWLRDTELAIGPDFVASAQEPRQLDVPGGGQRHRG